MKTQFFSLLIVAVGLSGCLSELDTRPSASSRKAVTVPPPGPTPSATPTPTPTVINGNALPYGGLGAVSMSTGAVSGWARDLTTPNQSIFIEIYIDGPAGTGVFAATMMANVNRTFFPVGPFGFNYTIPAQYQDGKIHRLYVYGIDTTNSARGSLDGSPVAFSAGLNAAGMNYYNNTVSPAVQGNCGACHTFNSYESLKTLLMSPSKFDGGSATNNYLYIRAIGGDNHGGGVRCNSGQAPCSSFITWWGLEFN